MVKRASYGTLTDDGPGEMPEDHDLLEYNGFVGVLVLDHGPETYARERNLPSRYVGDIDRLLVTPDTFHIIDYKTNDLPATTSDELAEH